MYSKKFLVSCGSLNLKLIIGWKNALNRVISKLMWGACMGDVAVRALRLSSNDTDSSLAEFSVICE